MDTSASGGGHGSEVYDEVSDLAVKVVLIGVPICAVVLVRIRVDQGNTLETSSTLDGRWVQSVSYQLGVIVLDDWFRY